MPLSKNGKYYSDKKKPSQREIEGAINLLSMCKKNPHLKTLIDTFDLKQVKQTNMPITPKKTVTAKPKSDVEEKKQAIYPEGIRFFAPHTKAPDFVIASVIINRQLLIDWLSNSDDLATDHEEYGSQIKLQLCQNDKNGAVLKVDTYGLDKS